MLVHRWVKVLDSRLLSLLQHGFTIMNRILPLGSELVAAMVARSTAPVVKQSLPTAPSRV